LVAVLNAGSSTLKYELLAPDEAVVAQGTVERIGTSGEAPDHTAAVGRAFADLEASLRGWTEQVAVVGHRVVHGGPNLWRPTPIDDAALAELERCTPLAPLHNPPALAVIRAARAALPGVPHVAVFDTGFHHDLPAVARTYALPIDLAERFAIRRYGFHGVSCEFLTRRLAELDPGRRRVALCHLGAGSSVTATLDGRSVDTSMGFTPLEGLVMATRSGDLDPAIPLVLQERGIPRGEVDRLLERESGLKGLSGTSGDFREVEAGMARGDARARLAFEVFAYRVRKYLGAYAAALGGLDTIVFAAGIGEHSAALRAAVVGPLAWLGPRIDPALNRDGPAERRISPPEAPTSVWIIPTDESRAIARAVRAIVA
jgi:acetate kinase